MKREIVSEKLLERKLKEGVKKKGGKAMKFKSPGYSGVPDRIVIMPGNVHRFAELKTTGRPLTPQQKAVHAEFEVLGHPVAVIDSHETLNAFLAEL